MKPILAAIVLLLSPLCASAAFQYAVESSSTSGSPYAGYTIRVTEGSGILSLGQWSNNAALGSSWITGFGYYTDASNLISGTVVTQSNGQSEYRLGSFSEGDTISVWVSTTLGTAGTSDSWQNLIFRGSLTSGTDQVLYMVTNGYFISFTVDGKPAGQPLPGVLVTALLGAGTLLPFRKRLFRKAK